MSFNKGKYDQQYMKENVIVKKVQFNRQKEEDMQMLTWAESRGAFNAYVRSLIRQDMESREIPESRK